MLLFLCFFCFCLSAPLSRRPPDERDLPRPLSGGADQRGPGPDHHAGLRQGKDPPRGHRPKPRTDWLTDWLTDRRTLIQDWRLKMFNLDIHTYMDQNWRDPNIDSIYSIKRSRNEKYIKKWINIKGNKKIWKRYRIKWVETMYVCMYVLLHYK